MAEINESVEIKDIVTSQPLKIKEVEVPIEHFFYCTDKSILDKLYEESDDCRLGDLNDLLALPRPTFPKKEDGKEEEGSKEVDKKD